MEEGWPIVYSGILKLRSRLEKAGVVYALTAEEYMMLYTTIYNMHKYRRELYDKYGDSLKEYMASVVLPALGELQCNELMLKELVRRWAIYKVMLRNMSRLFYPLEMYFIPRYRLPTLTEVGLLFFRDMVYDHEMWINVKNVLTTLIGRERDGEIIDGVLVKNVLSIYEEIPKPVDMDSLTNCFEAAVSEGIQAYYSEKAASWILEDSCTDYLLKAEECLKREDRIANYLQSISQQKLLEIVQNELLSRYQTRLLEDEHSGCLALLKNYRMDDFSRMCRLFCRIPNGLKRVVGFFLEYIISEGTSLVTLAEDAVRDKVGRTHLDGIQQRVAYVGTVVELHDKYMKYVKENTFLHLALKKAFVIFCNKEVAGNSSAQMLATVCDDLLKSSGSEKLSDDDIKGSFEKVAKFVTYIRDNDQFEEIYWRKLASRLLSDKTTNINHEVIILSKLKQQCDGQLVSKMEGMVADLIISEDSQTKFMVYLTENPNIHLGTELTVTVLSTGLWPGFNFSELNLPLEMVKCVEVFREFYSTEFKHRQLTWVYSLGTCNIIGMFDMRPIKMLATTYHAALLLLFNASEKLSCSEIESQLNLTNRDVVRLLYSLACAKYKILLKVPNTTTIITDDDFEFNPSFTNRKAEIKIPLPLVADDENKRTAEVVGKDRRFAIDALIVRIMKNTKVLPYDQLISECMEHLNSGRMFKLDIKPIKQRVEDLITREYLERDEHNRHVLRYLP